MRIFICPSRIDEKIAGEMINLESGKRYFYEGELVNEPEPYPVFDSEKSRTYIKPSYGVIFLPETEIDYIIPKIIEKLENFEQILIERKINHLGGPMIMETGHEHFTVLKGTSIEMPKRSFIREDYAGFAMKGRNSTLLTARFVWHIYTINDLLKSIEAHVPRIAYSSQLVSILYDKHKIFNYEDNTKIIESACYKNIDKTKNLKHITYIGELTEPSVKKLFPNLYGQYLDNPCFNMAWKNDAYLLILCFTMKGGYEIIRRHGDWKIYVNMTYSIPTLPNSKYVKFSEISIDNSIKKVNRNDICCCCKTPLYDRIYICRYPTGKSYAICKVCAGCNFDENGKFCALGTKYYKNEEILSTDYPRSHTELINNMDVSNLIKDILLNCFAESTKCFLFSSDCMKMGKYLAIKNITDYVLFYKDEAEVVFPCNILG